MKSSPRLDGVAKAVILSVVLYFVITSFPKPSSVTTVAISETSPIGAYWDIDCTNRVQSVNWGDLYPGTLANVPMYIKNEGDTSVRLSLGTGSWVPSLAADYMDLDWDYKGQLLGPDSVLPLTLKLSVSPSLEDVTTFSFNIIISASDSTLDVTVGLKIGLDQDGYVVVEISFTSSSILAGGLGGYVLNLSASRDVVVASAAGGQAPFNAAPSVRKVEGKFVVSASTSASQGPQMNGLKVAKMRLRLNGSAGAICTIRPVGLEVTDASNGAEYIATVSGPSLRFLRGDANKDGQVSIADAMFIAQYLVGTRPISDLNPLNSASVCQDGDRGDKITIADAMFIAQYLVGQRNKYYQP